jgi:hypothetical protein
MPSQKVPIYYFPDIYTWKKSQLPEERLVSGNLRPCPQSSEWWLSPLARRGAGMPWINSLSLQTKPEAEGQGTSLQGSKQYT